MAVSSPIIPAMSGSCADPYHRYQDEFTPICLVCRTRLSPPCRRRPVRRRLAYRAKPTLREQYLRPVDFQSTMTRIQLAVSSSLPTEKGCPS